MLETLVRSYVLERILRASMLRRMLGAAMWRCSDGFNFCVQKAAAGLQHWERPEVLPF